MQRTEKLGYSYEQLHKSTNAFFVVNTLLIPLILNIGLNGLDLKKYGDMFKLIFAAYLIIVLVGYNDANFRARTERQLKNRADSNPTRNHTFYLFNNKSEVQRTFANISLNGACLGLGLYHLGREILNPSYDYPWLIAYVTLISAGLKGHCRNSNANFNTEVDHYQPAPRQ